MRYFGRLAKRIGVTVGVAVCIGTGLLLTLGVGPASATDGSIAGHVTKADGGSDLAASASVPSLTAPTTL